MPVDSLSCRNPIDEWVPISTATDPDFSEKKVPVTQYDGHVIESTGLIKWTSSD